MKKTLSDISTLERGDLIISTIEFIRIVLTVDSVSKEDVPRVSLTGGNHSLASNTRYLYNQVEIDERVQKANWVLASIS